MPRCLALVAGALASLCILAIPSTAHAGKDMNKRVGLGGQRTLAGANEVHVKFFVDTRLSLGFGFGMWLNHDGSDDDNTLTQSAFSMSPEVFGWFLRTRETGPVAASFGIGGRFTLLLHNADGTVVEPILEVPLTAEVYVGEHFAIAPEAGLAFRLNSGGATDNMTLTTNGGSGAAIMGGGSFHFYF